MKKIKPSEKRLHLGDLVNIVQTNLDANQIVDSQKCKCCGNSAAEVLSFVITLLKLNIQTTSNESDAQEVFPFWSNSEKNWSKTPYLKPQQPRCIQKFISYSFDVRSNIKYKRPLAKDIDYFLKNCPLPCIDLGDQSSFSLPEKYEKIASSLFFVGANNGLTHLAMMSETQTFLLTNPCRTLEDGFIMCRRMFPDTSQIYAADNSKEIVKCIKKSIISYP